MSQFPFRDFLRETEDGKKALTTANHVMTESGIWVPQRGSDDGSVNTRLTGSNMEYYSKDEATMPSANSVPLGAFCMVVDTGNIWQSNGTDWKVFA